MSTTLHIAAVMAAVTSLAAGPNPHPVSRIRTGEDREAVYYSELMGDGSSRQSQVPKPRPPEYPHTVTLIATNDFPRYYELVYASVYDNGRVRTNSTVALKSHRDLIGDTLPPMPDPPAAREVSPAADDALAHAKARLLRRRTGVETATDIRQTNAIIRMAPRQMTVVSAVVAGSMVIQTMSDGSTNAVHMRRAHTARVAAATPPAAPKDTESPIDGGRAASAAAGFIVGAAAAVAATRRQGGARS